MNQREVRAVYTDQTITVYQAYPAGIAEAALRAGRLVPLFRRDRMTWIKPSFCWMMYRCGWATKPDQEGAAALLPVERAYPLLPAVTAQVGAGIA